MKKVIVFVLLIVFGVGTSLPMLARANANSANRAVQKNDRKMARKNAKQRKKDMKASRKATRKWKKNHNRSF
jgi:Sec-independent protein translocase protein TatA